jgi:hypothetical protein
MQKNIRNRKLTLQTTTVRTLDAQKLEEVAGARPRRTHIVSCAAECQETEGY